MITRREAGDLRRREGEMIRTWTDPGTGHMDRKGGGASIVDEDGDLMNRKEARICPMVL